MTGSWVKSRGGLSVTPITAHSARAAYRHTVESSVCLSPDAIGKGLGKLLYSAAIASATEKGFCEMIGVIALPNAASVALHRTLGFQEVGVLRSVGHKFDRYIDTGIWQRRHARRRVRQNSVG